MGRKHKNLERKGCAWGGLLRVEKIKRMDGRWPEVVSSLSKSSRGKWLNLSAVMDHKALTFRALPFVREFLLCGMVEPETSVLCEFLRCIALSIYFLPFLGACY